MALTAALVGSDAVFSNLTSHVVTITQDVAEGDGILVFVCSGQQGFSVSEPTVTDSAGNTYTRRNDEPAGWPSANEPFVNLGFYECLNCLTLVTGSTVTVSVIHTLAPPECAHIVQVVRLRGIRPVEAAGTGDTGGPVSSGAGHVVLVDTASISPGGGSLVVGAVGWTNYAGDTPVLDASFTVLDDAATLTGRTLLSDGVGFTAESRDRRCILGWKIGSPANFAGQLNTAGNALYNWSGIIVGFGGGFTNPWNLETRGGEYHYAAEQGGDISYWYSITSRLGAVNGPFVLDGGGDDHHFRMCEETSPAGRVRGVLARGAAVGSRASDDEGQTWGAMATLWGAGKNPTVAHDPRSEKTIYLAFVTDHLEGRVQGPGDSSPGAAFALKNAAGANLPVDANTSFHVQPAADTPGRWLLILIDGGLVKNYMSADDGPTWSVA